MTKPERSQYCVFYPGKEGNLVIHEHVGVDDLGKIFREVKAAAQEDEFFAFNMKGISQLSDITNSPEKTFILVNIKNGDLTVYTEVGPEAEKLIADSQHYYLIDDVYVVSDTALSQFLKENK